MEKLKDSKGIESSLGNLGSVYFYQGSLEKAEDSYQRALQIMVESNDPLGQGIYNEYLGNISIKIRRLVLAYGTNRPRWAMTMLR